MALTVSDALTLPSGTVIKNRLGKSAMSETLGSVRNHASPALAALYRRWAEGGTGLLITGNVMVDHRALGEPNNVVIEDRRDMPLLRSWAQAGKVNGTETWMQLNHPGKQSPNLLSDEPVAPSAIPFGAPLNRAFNAPRALADSEIEEIIERFANTAEIAEEAGFTGVQIHGAHGYLVSQFLSPRHNERSDRWGGSLDNRMRFVIGIYEAIRKRTGPAFNVSIKMNSADFQRGGFTEAESMTVAETLGSLGMDLIEISGGTYASPEMTGVPQSRSTKASTQAREAYFMEYAEKVRQRVSVPLMITGGFRSGEGIRQALASGAMDMAGLARPLAVDPAFSQQVLDNPDAVSSVKPIKTGIKAVDNMAMMETAWYTRQIHRLAKGKAALPDEGGLASLLKVVSLMAYRGLATRALRA